MPCCVPLYPRLIGVQAAASLAAFTLDTPAKRLTDPFAITVIDDTRLSKSPKSLLEDEGASNFEEDIEVLRKKFVGEIDLPESAWFLPYNVNAS